MRMRIRFAASSDFIWSFIFASSFFYRLVGVIAVCPIAAETLSSLVYNLLSFSVPCLGSNMLETEHEPVFLAPLDNITVTQGRDISFTCVVNDLGPYRVSGCTESSHILTQSTIWSRNSIFFTKNYLLPSPNWTAPVIRVCCGKLANGKRREKKQQTFWCTKI